MSIAVHSGFANSFSDILDRKPVVPTVTGSPFRDVFAVAASVAAEKSSHVPDAITGSSAEFDPFSVVRSGAVPEDNAFVLALKRTLEQRAREICTGERWDTLQQGVLDRTIDPWSAADEMLRGVEA